MKLPSEKYASATTKEIIITAKPYDFNTAKALIKDTANNKTKQNLDPLPTINVKQTDLTKIGYEPPTFPDGVSIKSYQLKTGWKSNNNPNTFEVVFILQKGIHTSTETNHITITTKYDFTNHKNLIKPAISNKKKSELNPLPPIGVEQTDLTKIGYEPPTFPDGVSIKSYKLKTGLDDDEFKVEFVLQKDSHISTETDPIKITAKYVFTTELAKFRDKYSSWKKWSTFQNEFKNNNFDEMTWKDTVIGDKLTSSSDIFAHPDNMHIWYSWGFPTRTNVDKGVTKEPIDGVTREYNIHKFDTNAKHQTFEVKVTLIKGAQTATKEFTVIPDFDYDKTDETIPGEIVSTKILGELLKYLKTRKKGNEIKLEKIGINSKDYIPKMIMEYTFVSLEEQWNSEKWEFKVKFKVVQITNEGKSKREKFQYIIIKPKPYDPTTIRELFNDVTSTKTKSQLKTYLDSKAEDDVLDKDLIGYKGEPTLKALNGITVAYTLEEAMGTAAADQTFKVKVNLTKTIGTTIETATKDITITAAYDFTAAKRLIKDATSTKEKTKISLPTGADQTLIAEDIGYTPPNISGGVKIEKLVLLERWGTATGMTEKFRVKVFLRKGAETATKDIIITAAAV